MKFNKQKVVKVLPFLMFGYFFDKLSQAFQMSDGANIGAQVMNTVGNIGTVFQNPLLSFNPIDLLVGAAGGVIVKLIIYVKGKNAKKYRKGAVNTVLRAGVIMRISSRIWTLIFRKMLFSQKLNA